MKRNVAIGVGAAILVVVAVGAFLLWPRGTSEVTQEDALTQFRDRTSTSSTTAEDAGAGVVPEPGVYEYRATGEEVVKLGPLPAETRPLAERVTAVVVEDGGCFEQTLNLFEQHTETTRYCAANGGLTLERHTKNQQIGALSPTATMTCDPSTLIDGSAEPRDIDCQLEMSGGPASITATLAGEVSPGEASEVTVDGVQVRATPLVISYEVSGDLTGTWTETPWLDDSNLPVRIQRALDLSGPATFTEQSDLQLVSLTPST